MDLIKWHTRQFNRGKSEPMCIKNIMPDVMESIIERRKNANRRIEEIRPVLAST